MSAKSNALEQSIIEAVLKNTSFAGGANNYVALFTAMPGETGGGTEVTTVGTGYVRQPISAAAGWSAGGQVGGAYEVSNAAEIAYAVATAAYGTVWGFALFDAVTDGVMRYFNWLANAAYPFTAAATGDLFTAPGHALVDGDRVGLVGPSLPGGVAEGTAYYVRDASGATFKVSATEGGAAIDLTTDGVGTAHRLQPKTVGLGDQFKFPIGNIKISEA
jgi:hypothetical protein